MPAPFIKLPVAALADDRLSHRELRVLMALYSFGANPGDTVWPTREALSDLSRCHRSHVSAALKRLVECGWIDREMHGQHGNVYVLRLPETVAETATYKKPKVAKSVTKGSQIGNGKVAKSVTHITDQEQTIEQTNDVSARARHTEDKRPAGASVGGDGSHNGESAKPNSRAKPKRPIPDDWRPSEQCLGLLEQAGISRAFALAQLGEFQMFWQESGELRASWNATFVNRVKLNWARQPAAATRDIHATHQRPDNSAPGRIARAIADRNARQSSGPGYAADNVIELAPADYRAGAH